MEIRSKAKFYDLWNAGVLGNKLRTWTVEEWDRDGRVLPVGFREANPKGGGGGYVICHTAEDVFVQAAIWRGQGREPIVCEAAPDHRAIIQGELCRDVGGLAGLLGRVKDGKRMRDSLRDGDLKPFKGAAVHAILATYMDASSRADLDALFDLYPDAVVEFTCYDVRVGHIPGRSTIVWEVRDY